MMHTEMTSEAPDATEDAGLDLATFTRYFNEIEQQPAWRAKADKECEYYDGNQLDNGVLQAQSVIGMPPAIEPLIGPTIDAVLGMEAKTRTDWRVIPDSDKSGDDVADALNYKLNQAERQSSADRACSDAYASQVKAGIGWVEVSRDSDPFKFPYRCKSIHRNEIWWDFLSVEPDLSDARYLIRRRWLDRKQAELMFPDQQELIRHACSGWQGFDSGMMTTDGGSSTDLAMAWGQERGWSVEEQQWRDQTNQRVCLFECWYREWVRVKVLKTPDGRVVEYDESNEMHVQTVGSGLIEPVEAIVSKMRLSWWMGPHKLHDGVTPYSHCKFPYVAFWGKREDRTNVPYGLIRGMMYLQDEVNARIAKMQWGLAAVRVTRTEGVVLDDDETFRQEVARPDADIVLDHQKMQSGGVFKVERDFELNRQQYERLVDAREGIKRTGGIYDSFMGQQGNAKSGVQTSMLMEQSSQTLADINDNFRYARTEVGDLLISLIIEDMGVSQEDVTIDGGALKEDRIVRINEPAEDESGLKYLNNDVSRTKLKVILNDVPSTPSFRSQQLSAMSETFKAMPPQYQAIALPHLLSLMDVPNRDEIIEAVRKVGEQPSAEEKHQQLADGIAQDMAAINIKKIEAEITSLGVKDTDTMAAAVKKGVEAAFSAMQAAEVLAAVPQVAPIADEVMKAAGYQAPNPVGMDPNYPQLAAPAVAQMTPGAAGDTSPLTPAAPISPNIGVQQGIETKRADSVPGFADGGMIDEIGIDGLTDEQRTALQYGAQPATAAPRQPAISAPSVSGPGEKLMNSLDAGGIIDPNRISREQGAFNVGSKNGVGGVDDNVFNYNLSGQTALSNPLKAFSGMNSPVYSAYADGGLIQGPGNSTSDSIPAVNTDTGQPLAVSTGEMVLPADVVAALGVDFFNELIAKYHTPTQGQS